MEPLEPKSKPIRFEPKSKPIGSESSSEFKKASPDLTKRYAQMFLKKEPFIQELNAKLAGGHDQAVQRPRSNTVSTTAIREPDSESPKETPSLTSEKKSGSFNFGTIKAFFNRSALPGLLRSTEQSFVTSHDTLQQIDQKLETFVNDQINKLFEQDYMTAPDKIKQKRKSWIQGFFVNQLLPHLESNFKILSAKLNTLELSDKQDTVLVAEMKEDVEKMSKALSLSSFLLSIDTIESKISKEFIIKAAGGEEILNCLKKWNDITESVVENLLTEKVAKLKALENLTSLHYIHTGSSGTIHNVTALDIERSVKFKTLTLTEKGSKEENAKEQLTQLLQPYLNSHSEAKKLAESTLKKEFEKAKKQLGMHEQLLLIAKEANKNALKPPLMLRCLDEKGFYSFNIHFKEFPWLDKYKVNRKIEPQNLDVEIKIENESFVITRKFIGQLQKGNESQELGTFLIEFTISTLSSQELDLIKNNQTPNSPEYSIKNEPKNYLKGTIKIVDFEFNKKVNLSHDQKITILNDLAKH